MLSWSLLVVSNGTIVKSSYWNETPHKYAYQKSTSEKACPALHEELASSADGPYDDLYRYPAVGSKLLACFNEENIS
jgi:hypothetical protein